MELLLKKIALIIASLSALIGITPKLGGLPIEVTPYYFDYNDSHYGKLIDGKKTEITKTEYDNLTLKDGEVKFSGPKKKITILKDNEYVRTGLTDAGSTTPQIKIRQSGIESIKYLNEVIF